MDRVTKKVVIDPGHGGVDGGTSANGILEKDYTLKISKYMADRLNDLGITNALTRDSDVTLDANNRPKRVQELFGAGNDVIVVSNHINAGGGDGAEVIYALRNSDNLSRKIADEFIKSGQNVRKYYQRRLPSDSSKDYYYILRDTPNNESIIVEYGFADSTGDDVSQIKNNWENLAEAVVRALASYIGVPYTPPAGATDNYYVVKRGDTLYNIARTYGVTVDALKQANNLTSNNLTVGMGLIIPQTSTGTDETEYYIVKKGDSLYKIANMYNTTVQELKDLNNLSSNLLNIGQRLKVKGSPNLEANTYIVKAGDTLYSIAKKFNVTVDDIKQANDKGNNLLTIGEVLIIPDKMDSSNRVHMIKPGDTLWSIARMYNTTVEAIKSYNSLASNLLTIGGVLRIP